MLVAAYRDDAPDHVLCRSWIEDTLAGEEPFALSDLVLSGFLRVVTHPRVFALPTPLEAAMKFTEAISSAPHCVPVQPGRRHLSIFTALCRDADARGNLVPDAFLAALAIESGCEWITLDRDFARFEGLRWAPPKRA